MAKRDTAWTMTKYKRFISENRGAGELASYKPWLCIQDFPSRGRVTRLKSWKTNRIHHFFSDIQTRCFYMFEWNDDVLDIREHYPLLDLQEVVKDNKDLKQDFFGNQEPPHILTTTFLLTLRNHKYVARTVKLSSDLEKKSVQERLEIERRYWAAKNIEFAIITQKEIPTVMVKNIEWIHQSIDTYEERGLTKGLLQSYCSILTDKCICDKHSIRKITSDFDKENNLEIGTGLYVFKYLLATKQITIDMNETIEISKKYPNIIINRSETYAANQ